jgi:Na+/H+ antiporter NhaD/arsenite permease-like protein
MTDPRDPAASATRRRRRSGWDSVALFWGLVFVAVGLWFFATETLGLELPRIRWDAVWPIVLILIGLFVIVRGLRGRGS